MKWIKQVVATLLATAQRWIKTARAHEWTPERKWIAAASVPLVLGTAYYSYFKIYFNAGLITPAELLGHTEWAMVLMAISATIGVVGLSDFARPSPRPRWPGLPVLPFRAFRRKERKAAA